MKIETMGRLLLGLGGVFLLYAKIIMPVSLPGADVVNINLLLERQNTQQLGWLLIFAGIAVTAVFKMKQTKEEREKEREGERERSEQTKKVVENVLQKTSDTASHITKSALGKFGSGKFSVAVRLLAGVICGGVLGASLAFYSYALVSSTSYTVLPAGMFAIALLGFASALAYAFWQKGTLKTASHLIAVVVVLIIINLLLLWAISPKSEDCSGDVVLSDHCKDVRYGNKHGERN